MATIFRPPLGTRLWPRDPAGVAVRTTLEQGPLALALLAAPAAAPFKTRDQPNPAATRDRAGIAARTALEQETGGLALGLLRDTFFGGPGQPNVNTDQPPPPRGYPFPVANRTHVEGLKLNLLRPFAQADWPVPRGYAHPVALRTHLAPVALNLLGLDAFFGGAGQGPAYDWPNPTRARRVQQPEPNVNLALATLLAPPAAPFVPVDQPNPVLARDRSGVATRTQHEQRRPGSWTPATLVDTGFETGDARDLAFLGSGASVQASTVIRGGWSLKQAAAGSFYRLNLSTTQSVARAYATFPALPGSLQGVMVERNQASTNRLRLGLLASGKLRLEDLSGTLGFSQLDSAAVLTAGTPYCLEVALDTAAGGIVRLWINGRLEIDSTHSTDPTSATRDWFVNGAATPNEVIFDDLRLDIGTVSPIGMVPAGPQPSANTEWPNPTRAPWRAPEPGQPVNLLETTLAPAAPAPFAQDDWPVPRGPRRPHLDLAAGLPATIAGIRPFWQSDWPVPARARRAPAADPVNLLGTTLGAAVVLRPFAGLSWALPQLARPRTPWLDAVNMLALHAAGPAPVVAAPGSALLGTVAAAGAITIGGAGATLTASGAAASLDNRP